MSPAAWVVLAVCHGYQLTDEPRHRGEFRVAVAPDGDRTVWRPVGRFYQVFMDGVPVMVNPLECE